jgi:ribosomal protein S27E
MDIDFKCRHCEQELSVDSAGAGTEILCPACGGTIVIPAQGTAGAPNVVNAMATSAAAKESKHFVVPQREKPKDGESLIAKPLKSLETAAHDGIHLRVKCIRHFDCVEVGRDRFDELVTDFINKVGEPNIVKIETFPVSHRDLETREWVTDYGVFILYRG